MNVVDPQIESLRLPPHSIEAEQSVLGGLLLDNSALEHISDILSEDDFYRHDHRVIWRHVCKIINLDRPADVVTIYESLETEGKAEEIGGLAYLNALAQNTPSAANIRRYAEIVRERAMLRKLVSIADEIASEALNPKGKEARQLLDEAEARIFKIAQEGTRSENDFHEMSKLLIDVVDRIDELAHRDNVSDVTGVPTGFVDLDRKTSGMHPGDLIIVAGRPSMGKTSFSMNIGSTWPSIRGCLLQFFLWKWVRFSWPPVCWVQWGALTSNGCVPDVCWTTTGPKLPMPCSLCKMRRFSLMKHLV